MMRIIGIDPGETCGMVALEGGHITSVFNIMSEKLMSNIQHLLLGNNIHIVIEDIRPYSLRLTPQVIQTCKFIGEVAFRLKSGSNAIVQMIPRSEVKKWCFDTFPEVCVPLVDKKILKKGFINKETGAPRKASFIFVDDKIVTECMKFRYQIEKPKSGYGYQFGLKEHSWQALAIATLLESKLAGTPVLSPQDVSGTLPSCL